MTTKPIGISRERVLPGTPVPWSDDPLTLDLLFIGSGNAFSKSRGECNWVLGHRGAIVAGDVGRLWLERAEAYGITPASLTGALITHCHSDHAGGLAALSERRRYLHGELPKLRLAAHPDVLPILMNGTLRGPIGGHEVGVGAADFFEVAESAQLDERSASVRLAGGIVAELFRTMHAPTGVPSWRESDASAGVFIRRAGLWISGDTRAEAGLAESFVARGAEWLFQDVGRKPAVHLSLDEAVHLPAEVRRVTYVMHAPDDMSEAEVLQLGFAGLVEPGDLFRFQPMSQRIL